MFAGLTVTVGGPGSAAAGDSFLVQATRPAIAGLERLISDPKLIAAARGELPFGASDNDNARKLAQVLTSGYLDGGKTSLIDLAARLASRVGSQARSAQLALDVQRLAAEETSRERSNLYGVNLDEEAANLMRFQQAYQASAAVIRVANELFDELLSATR
jgi:flagellar hook-associated protein 1 FlgK